MRISKRKWSICLAVVVAIVIVASLIESRTDDTASNVWVGSLKFDAIEWFSSFFVQQIFQYQESPVSLKQFSQITVNDFRFRFLPAGSNHCLSETFIFLIKSSLRHFDNRKIIRNHFSRFKLQLNISYQWFFFVGLEHEDNDIFDEQKNHSDLVIVNFVDTYINNTLKLMSEFYWLRDNLCKSVHGSQRFIFMDDDVFINFKQIESLKSTSFDQVAIYGHKLSNASPFRWRWSKWYISREQYISNRYPPYVSGSTIVTNRKALMKISQIIPHVKYFPFDDVFLGIAAEIVHVDVVNDKRILVDFKCGLFCYEDVDHSIAVHVPNNLAKLRQLSDNAKKL